MFNRTPMAYCANEVNLRLDKTPCNFNGAIATFLLTCIVSKVILRFTLGLFSCNFSIGFQPIKHAFLSVKWYKNGAFKS